MPNNDLLLSFIVPFYGVEKYIEECIRSLYNQDVPHDRYEVITIDDCSPDNSRKIVERLATEYPTIKILTCPENLKQGGARNLGLQHARGKYVWFVDSDDYIVPNCLKQLLDELENNKLDILDFDFKRDNNTDFSKSNIEYTMGPCTGEEYVFDTRVKWDWKCCCVCGCITLRTLTDGIKFAEHVQYEDDDYAKLLYARANKVKHIPLKPYKYRHTHDSAVHKSASLHQITYHTALIQRYIRIIEGNTLSSRWENGIKHLVNEYCNKIINLIPLLTDEERKQYYKQKMWKIDSLSNYVGLKKRLRLRNHIFLKYCNKQSKKGL